MFPPSLFKWQSKELGGFALSTFRFDGAVRHYIEGNVTSLLCIGHVTWPSTTALISPAINFSVELGDAPACDALAAETLSLREGPLTKFPFSIYPLSCIYIKWKQRSSITDGMSNDAEENPSQRPDRNGSRASSWIRSNLKRKKKEEKELLLLVGLSPC